SVDYRARAGGDSWKVSCPRGGLGELFELRNARLCGSLSGQTAWLMAIQFDLSFQRYHGSDQSQLSETDSRRADTGGSEEFANARAVPGDDALYSLSQIVRGGPGLVGCVRRHEHIHRGFPEGGNPNGRTRDFIGVFRGLFGRAREPLVARLSPGSPREQASSHVFFLHLVIDSGGLDVSGGWRICAAAAFDTGTAISD